MSCSDTNKELLFYAEGSLDEEKRKAVEAHLSECPECNSYLDFLNETLGYIEMEKAGESDTHFFDRVMLRYDRKKRKSGSFIIKMLPKLAAAAVFAGAVAGGASLGKLFYGNTNSKNYAMNEELSFLNEMKQENIESFFLTFNDDGNE